MTIEEAREVYLDSICSLCNHPYQATQQEELDAICDRCGMDVALDNLLKLSRSVGAMQALQIVKEEFDKTFGGDSTCT